MNDEPTALTVTRNIGMPMTEVWQAWTDPERLSQWWWPARFQTRYQIDQVVGGSYRFETADVPPMGVLDLAGTFTVVAPPRHLVYTWRWARDLGHESRVSVDFIEKADCGTNLSVRHEGLKDDGDRDNHVQGWNDCLDRLEGLEGRLLG